MPQRQQQLGPQQQAQGNEQQQAGKKILFYILFQGDLLS